MSTVIPFRQCRCPTADVWLTKRQLARMWGYSERWVDLRVQQDGLPAYQTRDGKRFRLQECAPWFREWVGMIGQDV